MYFESKFVATEDQKDLVQDFLNTHLAHSDPYPLDRVQNLYFDTFNLKSADMAFSDESYKKKFRLRLYDSTNQYSVQMKIKKNSFTEKRKLKLEIASGQDPFQFDSWESILLLAKEGQPGQSEFQMDSIQWGRLEPLVGVEYTRRRYRIGDYRITWDTDIVYSATNFYSFAHKRAEPSHGILEIKSNSGGIAPFVTQGLGLNLKQTNISKFKSALLGLKLLHPPFSDYTRNDYGFKSII